MHFPQEQMENAPRQTVCDTTSEYKFKRLKSYKLSL